MRLLEQHKCYGGTISVYEHDSAVLGCPMRFSVFLPQQAKTEKVPFFTFLAGLTCTYENFTTKAGAYEAAAKHGLAFVAPDTSPRGDDIADNSSYDLGQGAGFYINAVQEPWAQNYQMETYITDELNKLVTDKLPLNKKKQGVMGHSMGGHGALTLFFKYSELYKSVSAFAPITAPKQVPWGVKAFSVYLGKDETEWEKHDASCLALSSSQNSANSREKFSEILVDQGDADPFLKEQLQHDAFIKACKSAGQKLNLRMQAGYDHSYYFIQTFIADHIEHHSKVLQA